MTGARPASLRAQRSNPFQDERSEAIALVFGRNNQFLRLCRRRLLRRHAPRNDARKWGVIASEAKQSPSRLLPAHVLPRHRQRPRAGILRLARKQLVQVHPAVGESVGTARKVALPDAVALVPPRSRRRGRDWPRDCATRHHRCARNAGAGIRRRSHPAGRAPSRAARARCAAVRPRETRSGR